MAVPREDPRFDTLRESREISPCRSSGKLDWPTLTEGVSVIAVCTPLTVVPRSLLMSVVITFMLEPAKLQMNWAKARGSRTLVPPPVNERDHDPAEDRYSSAKWGMVPLSRSAHR